MKNFTIVRDHKIGNKEVEENELTEADFTEEENAWGLEMARLYADELSESEENWEILEAIKKDN